MLNGEKTHLTMTEEGNAKNNDCVILSIQFPDYPFPVLFDDPTSLSEIPYVEPNIKQSSEQFMKKTLLGFAEDCLKIPNNEQQSYLW